MPLLCVQQKIPDDGHRNCPKHVEFHSKNKFEKLVYLVGFIIHIPQNVGPPVGVYPSSFLMSTGGEVTGI